MVVPFEDNKYNTKEIYLLGVFCTYTCLNCYRLCEPITLYKDTKYNKKEFVADVQDELQS